VKRSAAALAFLIAVSTICAARVALAADGASVVIWPTLTPAGDAPSAATLHKPVAPAEKVVAERAQDLDATLRDAVQDLGFTLYVADAGPTPGHTRDTDLIDRAAKAGAGGTSNTGTWVVSPRLESAGGDAYVLRIVAVAPNGRELRVRVENVAADSVSVRGIVMLRDLLTPTAAQAAAIEHDKDRLNEGAGLGVMSPLRSQGRAVLSVNSALFGAFLAYSIQRSSGSDDPRVLYPLLALGTGVGLGSALLVAEEWDVTTGDAWFLSAGGWWGAGAGILIANGRHVQPLSDRYAWGVGGGFAGLGLATLTLTRIRMDEGDAMLAHSGAALGLFLGGLGELAYRGTTTDSTPFTGMGYGSAFGLVAAGAISTQVTTSPSRVLLIDLGAGLGALAGAALASPLIFGDVTEGKSRGWLTATMGGSLAGGTLAWLLTKDAWSIKRSSFLPLGTPTAGVIGSSATRNGAVPAYGIGWRGDF
jgi:hypothetical protein